MTLILAFLLYEFPRCQLGKLTPLDGRTNHDWENTGAQAARPCDNWLRLLMISIKIFRGLSRTSFEGGWKQTAKKWKLRATDLGPNSCEAVRWQPGRAGIRHVRNSELVICIQLNNCLYSLTIFFYLFTCLFFFFWNRWGTLKNWIMAWQRVKLWQVWISMRWVVLLRVPEK